MTRYKAKRRSTGLISMAAGLLTATMLLRADEKPGPSQPPGSAADAHAEHHHLPLGSQESPAAGIKVGIPDLPVLNQDGRKVRFYTDLVKGKVVAVNFIFTTCTTVCPPLSATFAKIQSLTGDRSGKDFHLISVSVDPVTDTPPRLKAWLAKFGARPGWTFVTGEKSEMDKLLSALGASTARKEDHTPLVLIGNDAKGIWTRAYGLAPASRLTKLIEAMIRGLPVEANGKESSQP